MELRPLEKAIERLIAKGEDAEEIAGRFHRSPRWSLQVAKLIDYKRGLIPDNMESPHSSGPTK